MANTVKLKNEDNGYKVKVVRHHKARKDNYSGAGQDRQDSAMAAKTFSR